MKTFHQHVTTIYESASEEAKSRGLVYMGFGKYGDPKTGKATHKSDGNSLVQLTPSEQESGSGEEQPSQEEAPTNYGDPRWLPTNTRIQTFEDFDGPIMNLLRRNLSDANFNLRDLLRPSYYPDPEQAERDLENRRRRAQPFTSLNDDQKIAIRNYTEDGFRTINPLLRTGNMVMGDSPVKRQLADYLIRNLSGGLLDLPNAPDATYSRGLTGSNEQLREFMNLPEGSEFYDRGFGSYTSGGNPELDYFLRSGNKYNGVMELVSPSMKDISELSRYPAEKEHLMMPNRKFKIVENNPEGHYSRNVGYVPRIRVEEIPDY